MSIVIKQSVIGTDVKNCGIEDISFISNKYLFKLYDIGTWQITLTDNDEDNFYNGNQTIPHNLGYIPGFTVYGEWAEGGEKYMKYGGVTAPGDIYTACADDINLYIKITVFNPNKTTINGNYAIYIDPLQE